MLNISVQPQFGVKRYFTAGLELVSTCTVVRPKVWDQISVCETRLGHITVLCPADQTGLRTLTKKQKKSLCTSKFLVIDPSARCTIVVQLASCNVRYERKQKYATSKLHTLINSRTGHVLTPGFATLSCQLFCNHQLLWFYMSLLWAPQLQLSTPLSFPIRRIVA